MTEGREAPPEGLAVLRQRGLHGWIDHITTVPFPLPRPASAAASALPPTISVGTRSPLLCLCTDLLIATLIPKQEAS